MTYKKKCTSTVVNCSIKTNQRYHKYYDCNYNCYITKFIDLFLKTNLILFQNLMTQKHKTKK